MDKEPWKSKGLELQWVMWEWCKYKIEQFQWDEEWGRDTSDLLESPFRTCENEDKVGVNEEWLQSFWPVGMDELKETDIGSTCGRAYQERIMGKVK